AAGPRAEARGVRLVADAGEALPPVEVDSARIAQVLANLLDNALRYTPAGEWIQVGAPAAARDDSAPRVAIPAAALATVATPSERTNEQLASTAVAPDPAGTSPNGNGTGGVMDRLPVPAHQSSLTTHHSPGVCFWVADSGPGIAADALPHVFE